MTQPDERATCPSLEVCPDCGSKKISLDEEHKYHHYLCGSMWDGSGEKPELCFGGGARCKDFELASLKAQLAEVTSWLDQQLVSENSDISVRLQEMAGYMAKRRRDAWSFMKLAQDREAQLAEATETYTAPDGEVWSPPTAEAYYLACQALKVRREKLAEAEKERDELSGYVHKCPDCGTYCKECKCYDDWRSAANLEIRELRTKLTAATARAEAAEKELEALKERIAATGELVRTGKHCRMAEHMTDSCDCGEITAEYDALLAQPEGGSDGK